MESEHSTYFNMNTNKKIIDKICKCLRLSESGNPNEAALALRQATRLMEIHGITDSQIMAADVSESATQAGQRYNPPFWALALAKLVADAFQCRNLISRKYGRAPEFRFIGLGFRAEVATYSYTVLYRYLQRAIEKFELSILQIIEANYRLSLRKILKFLGHLSNLSASAWKIATYIYGDRDG